MKCRSVSQVSVFMLTSITLDRVVTLLFPLRAGRLRLKHARVIAGVGWGACAVLTLLPVLGIPYFGDAFFGRTGSAF